MSFKPAARGKSPTGGASSRAPLTPGKHERDHFEHANQRADQMPSERLLRVHTDMTQVISAIENLQAENMRIRFKAIGQMQNLCQSWFQSTNRIQLKNCFTEWKLFLRRKHNLEAVERAEEEAGGAAKRSSEVKLAELKAEHMRVLQEYIETHKFELGRINDAHLGHKENFAAELEQKLRSEHEEILQSHIDDHHEKRKSIAETYRTRIEDAHSTRKSMHEDYDAEHADQEKTLAGLELELKHAQRKLGRAVSKMVAMEKAMHGVRNSMQGYDSQFGHAVSPNAEPEATSPAMTVQEDERDYMKDALHEILEQVDPRYLGRSQHGLRSKNSVTG
mmetsp:Transcript_10678/g.26147  ORF Transcript_10678/g.26147 Transcript_10678/m.26147 type:complete len:334 (-) Transcript_10678:524-1525(-)|eukprot:CAMPEP_0178997470 /NCGR_PEP_ID=MMETSP0795-20121207/8943_1 /TAXON_ID=88552 /ORGANISM="Amoebophrya sp., Strain Ameob2" /LENGTH=333 /DNA_ID=CAMNT_0020689977 /DNA_START=149 /DNA_END=1150 /DNA_ORIENTATION=-